MTSQQNGIEQLFDQKANNILSVYFTAGYPQINNTNQIILALQNEGVDLLEVGIPFSDPVADGETIQKSSQQALNNGMSVQLLFDQLREIKNERTIPIVLMGYFNPILQFGIDHFCERCQEVGVDGLIIPDLPLHELESTYGKIFEQHGLKNILLITPQTPDERITKLDQLSTGFNYVVSSASTTGKTSDISEEQVEYLSRISKLGLKNPMIIGFGISDKKGFESVCRFGNGAIIGSAFIKSLTPGKLNENIKEFINDILR